MFYVYELRDETGKPFYVGKGSGRRMHQHEHHARAGRRSHLCAKIRKLFSLKQQIAKAVVFSSLEEEAAFTEEKRLIAYYGRINLTNQTDGGDGVSNPSIEARAKIAASRLGTKASEATRNRQKLAKLGSHRSAETKAKISEAQKKIRKPWACNSRPNLGTGFLGLKWSDEHRKNFLAKRIGHTVSAETRLKISISKKGSIPWNKRRV